MPVYSPFQPLDADLTTIAGLTATTDNFMQAKSSAWASRTPTQVTADLIAFVGDSGSGGTKGLVPAPVTGDATKFLRGDGTFVAIPGGGDALTSNPLSQFAATTSLELKGVISDETGSGALVFGTLPTFDSFNLVTTSSSTLGVIFQNSTRILHTYGTTNFFAGAGAGNFTLTSDANVGIGFEALMSLTNGGTNTAIGKTALRSCTSGGGNFALGSRALYSLTTSSNNVAIGTNALEDCTGDANVAIGISALLQCTDGGANIAIGQNSLSVGTANSTFNNNVGIGYEAFKNLTGARGTAIGFQALISNTSGTDNVGIGNQAGYTSTGANANTTGVQNTYIGAQSGPASTSQRSGMITIGYRALADADYTCAIGGTAAAGTAVDLVMGATTASAKAHFIKTTEQLRLGYDTSNYLSCTVNSTGSATFNLVGTTPSFTFSDDINLPADIGVNWTSVTAEPSAPASGILRTYSKLISGRMLPKWIGPSGTDTTFQAGLYGNRVIMFLPSTGTTGTGSGTSFGPAWTSNGTVSHPTPASTAPAISNQMKRTRYANVVTTTNQQLGPRFNAASERTIWRGNAAGLGGFFFVARFIVELYPASTVRIFAGLAGTNSTSVAISDTVINDVCGLWHDTTDPSSGANSFNFVTRDTSTTTKQSIALSNAIAAGNSYDFYMFCPPNGSTIYYRLDDIVNAATYEGSTSTTLPTSTTFLQPQVQMSNGTANTTVTTTAIGVASIYIESDR